MAGIVCHTGANIIRQAREIVEQIGQVICDTNFLSIIHVTYHRKIRKLLYRGYYTVARRYEFYFWVAKQYFTHECSEWVTYCFCHEKTKFISSSRRVMFFLLYRQNDINKIIERNYQNYVIDKLTCEIIENKPLGSRM